MVRTEEVREGVLEDEMEDGFPEENPGFFDSLSASFGAAPWWSISGTFHGLVLLLVILIGIAIMPTKDDPVVTIVTFDKPKPPVFDKKTPYAVFSNPIPVNEQQVVENAVVTHEVVEESDHNETNDDMNDNQAQGEEDAISDVPLGGPGTAASIGLMGSAGGSYGHRDIGGRRRLALSGGGSQKTEDSVERALRWLVNHQEPDGRWDCVKHGGQKADVAVTGLALLAFLGAGHTEKVGLYKKNVQLGVAWLKKIQQADGKYYVSGEVSGIGYHHAIAGLAMAEAAGMGMGKFPDTQKSAQRALDYSVNIHQKGEGSERRGWRYEPKSEKGDISVSGWFIMQLKSAKFAGLAVDPAAFDGAIEFLNSVEAKGAAGGAGGDSSYGGTGHRYGYTSTEDVGYRRTAIGCLSRQFLGWKLEELQGGVDWFVKQGGVPAWGANGGSVDLYYWYYGALCTFQQQGDVWNRWNEAMKKVLVDNQRQGGDEDGSWDVVGHYSGHWGRAGQTATACLCLEVYYRYLSMYR